MFRTIWRMLSSENTKRKNIKIERESERASFFKVTWVLNSLQQTQWNSFSRSLPFSLLLFFPIPKTLNRQSFVAVCSSNITPIFISYRRVFRILFTLVRFISMFCLLIRRIQLDFTENTTFYLMYVISYCCCCFFPLYFCFVCYFEQLNTKQFESMYIIRIISNVFAVCV